MQDIIHLLLRRRSQDSTLMYVLTALEELDLKDWAEIKTVARELFKSEQLITEGDNRPDQVKCYIAAFLMWCADNELEIKVIDHGKAESKLH